MPLDARSAAAGPAGDTGGSCAGAGGHPRTCGGGVGRDVGCQLLDRGANLGPSLLQLDLAAQEESGALVARAG